MINKIDHKVAEFFHKIYLWGGEIANKGMELISFIAEAGILFLLIGLALALFKRTRKIGGTILLSVAIGFIITNIILKPIIARARPFEGIGTDYYKWWLDAGMTRESGHSFPSGHTTATTAFALAIFLTTNKKYSWPILTLPILMASSRIYLMVHYFSDCLGGIAVGCVSAVIAWLVAIFIYKSKLKFCVWIRDLEIIKSGTTKKAPTAQQEPQLETAKSNPEEDYVYVRQADEVPVEQNNAISAENNINTNE